MCCAVNSGHKLDTACWGEPNQLLYSIPKPFLETETANALGTVNPRHLLDPRCTTSGAKNHYHVGPINLSLLRRPTHPACAYSQRSRSMNLLHCLCLSFYSPQPLVNFARPRRTLSAIAKKPASLAGFSYLPLCVTRLTTFFIHLTSAHARSSPAP